MVGGALLKSRLVDSMLRLVRHGLGADLEEGRLIHVVPEAGNASGGEILIKRAPPVAAALLSEVGEDGRARPDDAGVDRAVGIVDEVVPSDAFVVRFVALAGQVGDVQVSDPGPPR